jgi:hypothetical protein
MLAVHRNDELNRKTHQSMFDSRDRSQEYHDTLMMSFLYFLFGKRDEVDNSATPGLVVVVTQIIAATHGCML